MEMAPNDEDNDDDTNPININDLFSPSPTNITHHSTPTPPPTRTLPIIQNLIAQNKSDECTIPELEKYIHENLEDKVTTWIKTIRKTAIAETKKATETISDNIETHLTQHITTLNNKINETTHEVNAILETTNNTTDDILQIIRHNDDPLNSFPS
jgi:L-2-hydroxyglutarate oxidase LhgO